MISARRGGKDFYVPSQYMLQCNTSGKALLLGQNSHLTDLVSALRDEIEMEVPLIDGEVLFAAASEDVAVAYDLSNGLFLRSAAQYN